MKQSVDVEYSPEPHDAEEPRRSHDLILSVELCRADVVLIEDVLIVSDVTIPSSRADKQLRCEVTDLSRHFLGRHFDFVDHSRLR